MATVGREAGDGPDLDNSRPATATEVTEIVAKETTQLIPERSPVERVNNVQRGLYNSLSVEVESSQEQRNLIGGPVSREEEERVWGSGEKEVVIEDSHHGLEESTNDLQCLMHILKGNIGTGFLAMPIAVKNAGLWTGFAGILFIGAVATHCMHLLVKSSKRLSQRVTGRDKLGYAEVMELSLQTAPGRLPALAPAARRLVNALLLFTQYGFCCVYIVFIATSIKDVVDPSYSHSPNLRVYEAVSSVVLALYCMIKDLRTLAPFSFFANILTLAGIILIFVNITSNLPDTSKRPAFDDFKNLPLFFGTAIFAFEGISLVLPLESSMRERERFSGLSGVLNLSMVSVTCLYAAIGFFGYLKFGENVQPSITLSLPTSPWYYMIVKPMFAITIFVSFNVQLYVPIRIICPWLANRFHLHTNRQKNRLEYLLRLISVVVTMGCAMAIPHLDLLISLIGALASSSLAMILPALIHILTLVSDPDPTPVIIIIKDIFIIIIGIIGFITGTYTSLKEIVKTF